jgi:hypothetical protein
MPDIEKTAGPQPNVLWSESRGPASNIKKVNGSGWRTSSPIRATHAFIEASRETQRRTTVGVTLHKAAAWRTEFTLVGLTHRMNGSGPSPLAVP